MPGVFISYRRDDTKGFAGALARELNRRVGADLVFMDTADIIGGTDFPAVLRNAVQSADVLLAVIGPGWLGAADSSGQPRLHDPDDFVRREIALALERGIRVIPVLVEGARMPSAAELPAVLSALANCNALGLSNIHWDEDVARLTDHIHEAMYAHGLDSAAHTNIAPTFEAVPPVSRNVRRFIAFAIAVGLLFAAIAAALIVSQAMFTTTALHATAEVTGFHEGRSDDGGVSYYPELHFVTADGRPASFRATIGSKPPAYAVGERVPILYDPAQPDQASIDSAMGNWGVAMIFAAFGLLWLLLGLVPVAIRRARKHRYRDLLEHGRPIVTTFHEVQVNGSVTVQGRHPYVIVTQWRNPVSQQLVHFHSHQVWQDPTALAQKRMITVVVDPNNFRRYVMDLSFLHDRPRPTAETL